MFRGDMQENYLLGSSDPGLPILKMIASSETFNQKKLKVKQV